MSTATQLSVKSRSECVANLSEATNMSIHPPVPDVCVCFCCYCSFLVLSPLNKEVEGGGRAAIQTILTQVETNKNGSMNAHGGAGCGRTAGARGTDII